jgi:MFS family permease
MNRRSIGPAGAGAGEGRVRLGLRANGRQFALLVALNAVVGALVGLERSVLPVVGEREFGLATKTAVLSFILAFGAAKAVANLVAGELARRGRKPVLVAGWLLALPVPPLIAFAPSWGWIVAANVLLGASQGLAWSMTVLMKIDLAGPVRRGLALGLNESAGYVGVAVTAFATGALAASFGPRTAVWAGAAVLAVAGTLCSIFLVRETRGHVRLEHAELPAGFVTRGIAVWAQAGFVNNLNDGLMWGLVPLYLAARGASVAEIGTVAALYPAVWGVGQLGAGWLSDRTGRRPLVVAGMLVQAGALAVLLAGSPYAAAAVLGVGTALVYPTLIAAVSDSVRPLERARAVGAYRFWRDAGLVAGAAVSGVVADTVGSGAAIGLVAGLTAASGAVVAAAALRLSPALPSGKPI